MATIIDANVLVALFRSATADLEKVRIDGLIADAKASRSRLIIPSPALAEFSAKAHQHEMDFILEQKIFRVAAFDAKAALECGIMLRLWAVGEAANKKDRHKAKFDMQILAIAKSEGASILVTGDINLRKKATKEGIIAKDILDLPIPESAKQHNMRY